MEEVPGSWGAAIATVPNGFHCGAGEKLDRVAPRDWLRSTSLVRGHIENDEREP